MAARRKLDEEKAAMQRTLDFKRRELEGLREELASPRRAGMSPEVRREKFERFEDMRRAAARLADDFRNDLDNSERQFLAHARAEIAALVEQLGAQRGYFLIFEQKALEALKPGRPRVLYSYVSKGYPFLSPPISADDLTGEVIKLYDARKARAGHH